MANEASPGFLRLFIAVEVSSEVREEIARAQGQLRRCAPPGAIRWAQADQFHLTLKFLGDVTPDQADALRQPAAQICAAFPALSLSAVGLGVFPNWRRPRVIWAGVEDASGRLARLQRQIDEAMRPFAPAEKPQRFSAHITLGRVKPGHHGSFDPLWERAQQLRDRRFGEWQADEVVIYRSRLTSERAVHERFHVCRLNV